MMRFFKSFLLSIVLFSLVACNLFPIMPTQAKELLLLPPAGGPSARLLKQTVQLNIDDKQQLFLVVSKLTAEQTQVVTLTPTGQTLFSLNYDGEHLEHSSTFPDKLPFQSILAMMQFSLWPLSTIHHYYPEEKGWTVIDTPSERTLSTHNQPLLKVNFVNNKILINNMLQHYQIEINTLEKKDL